MRRAAVLAAALLTAQAPAPPDAVVAQSGTMTLTVGAVRKLLDAADPQVRQQVRADPAALAQVARTELLQRQLLDEAHAKKFDASPDMVARANRARDAAIVSAYLASLTEPPSGYPADADIDAAYESNKVKFMVPRQYHLAQAFIPVADGAPPAANDDAQRALRDARTQLAKPHAEFADIVGKIPGVQPLDRGGDLGWLREDQIIPSVRDAVTGATEGSVVEPVRAPDGWHLIKLLGTKPAGPAPLADVRDALVRALREQRQAQNERGLLADMQRRQPIRIDEIQLSHAIQ